MNDTKLTEENEFSEDESSEISQRKSQPPVEFYRTLREVSNNQPDYLSFKNLQKTEREISSLLEQSNKQDGKLEALDGMRLLKLLGHRYLSLTKIYDDLRHLGYSHEDLCQ